MDADNEAAEDGDGNQCDRKPAGVPLSIADLNVLIVADLICEAVEHKFLLRTGSNWSL
jgi:hypothetical protein